MGDQVKLNLIKFGGKWCPACNNMDRQRVLEQFSAVTPDVKIIKHECPEPDSDAEDPIADEYDAYSMPTLVFEDSTTGAEIARYEGGLNFSDLKAFYESVKLIQAEQKPVARWRQRKKYEPRMGGYYGVQARVEGSDNEAD